MRKRHLISAVAYFILILNDSISKINIQSCWYGSCIHNYHLKYFLEGKFFKNLQLIPTFQENDGTSDKQLILLQGKGSSCCILYIYFYLGLYFSPRPWKLNCHLFTHYFHKPQNQTSQVPTLVLLLISCVILHKLFLLCLSFLFYKMRK